MCVTCKQGRAALLLACLASVAGCAAVGSVQMSDTVGKGNLQVGLEPGLQARATGRVDVYPHFDAALRYGVSDTVDLGARLGMSMVEFQSKFLLTAQGNPSLAISLAPAVAATHQGFNLLFAQGQSTASAGDIVLNVALPLLVGVKLKGGSEVVLGPRLQNFFLLPAQGGSSPGALPFAYVLGVGGTLGFAARLSDNFVLLPEFGLVYPVFNSAGHSIPAATLGALGGQLSAQFKLGILLGRIR